EQPADDLTGAIEPGDRVAVAVLDLRRWRDLQAAEGEGDAASHVIGFERRCVDEAGPIRLVDRKATRAASVLDRRIERHLGHDRRIVLLHRAQEGLWIDAFELARELLESVGAHLGDAADAIL